MGNRLKRQRLAEFKAELQADMDGCKEIRAHGEIDCWAMDAEGSYCAIVRCFLKTRNQDDQPVNPQTMEVIADAQPMEMAVPVKIDVLQVRALAKQDVGLLAKARLDAVSKGVLYLAQILRGLREQAAQHDCTCTVVPRPVEPDEPAPGPDPDAGAP